MDFGPENYNPSATANDGSCSYPTQDIWGCMDFGAENYNPSATADDDSCSYPPQELEPEPEPEPESPVSNGWTCPPSLYGDSVCNCDCGVVDVDCMNEAGEIAAPYEGEFKAPSEMCHLDGKVCIDNLCQAPSDTITEPMDPCELKDKFPERNIPGYDPCGDDGGIREIKKKIPQTFYPQCSATDVDDIDAQPLPVHLSSGGNSTPAIEFIDKGAVPKEYRGKFKPLRSLVISDKQCFSWKEVSICSKEFQPYLDVKSAYSKVKEEGLCDADKKPVSVSGA